MSGMFWIRIFPKLTRPAIVSARNSRITAIGLRIDQDEKFMLPPGSAVH